MTTNATTSKKRKRAPRKKTPTPSQQMMREVGLGDFRMIGGSRLNPNHPQIHQNPPSGTFFDKFSTVGNWYCPLFKWGKITTWQEVQAISSEYERSTKMHGAF